MPVFILISALLTLPGAAQTVVSTDFSQAVVKAYNNGDIIGPASDPTAQLTANSGTYDGTAGQWGADTTGGNPQIKVVEVEGKPTLQLSEGTAVSKSIPDAISSLSALQLQGSLLFTILPSPAQGRSSALIILTKDNWFTTGGTNLLSLEISPSLALRYAGGIVPQTLTPGVKYRLDFTVDCSDPSQHTWDFTLHDLSDGTDKTMFASPAKMKTRNATAAPNTFLIHQYGEPATPSTDPLLNIEKVSLTGTAPDAAAPIQNPK